VCASPREVSAMVRFFTDLGLPEPDVNLHVGSGLHGEQTTVVLIGVERELMTRRPLLLAMRRRELGISACKAGLTKYRASP
jgi:hypothetical protein